MSYVFYFALFYIAVYFVFFVAPVKVVYITVNNKGIPTLSKESWTLLDPGFFIV